MVHSKEKYVFSRTEKGTDDKAIFINDRILETVNELKNKPGKDTLTTSKQEKLTDVSKYYRVVAEIRNGVCGSMTLALSMTIEKGILSVETSHKVMSFADMPYRYAVSGSRGQVKFQALGTLKEWETENDRIVMHGSFEGAGLAFTQTFQRVSGGWAEQIVLRNTGAGSVDIDEIDFGFAAELHNRHHWRLCAVPFRVQLDGSVHDYSISQLLTGEGHNTLYTDSSRENPPLRERGLRSEAWAWGDGDYSIAIIKYNNEQVEYSMACVNTSDDNEELIFGGVGFALYGEPSGAQRLEQGAAFEFGETYYFICEGGHESVFTRYRDFLEARGHTFGPDYDPPVNWNVLYDIGWHHSDSEKLRESYHRESILAEAVKARDCGCQLLYLDPGWEVAEGLTIWDEARIGTVQELVRELKEDFGLDLGYRTVLRAYKPHWDVSYLVKGLNGKPTAEEKLEKSWGYSFWEPCLCDPSYFDEKLRRILAITSHGIRFMMFDEMDWRGPCYDKDHGHPVPSTPLDHIKAVYRLAAEVRRAYPNTLTEVHDPLSPWTTMLYAPTYYEQGAEGIGSYDENWGFEYMWNCIEDLKTGKAMALYYYNLGCSIPLYLHITMAADNDNSIFFWWAASTVRHLGIGGKSSHPSVEFAGELAPYDKEQRYHCYRAQMFLYNKLKPYFSRGVFHGIEERIHLHTLAGMSGGVVNVFNLEDEARDIKFRVPKALLGDGNSKWLVIGADVDWDCGADVEFSIHLGAMSPGIITVGDAAVLSGTFMESSLRKH